MRSDKFCKEGKIYENPSLYIEHKFGGYSIRKRELALNKVYLCDMGFAKLAEVSQEKGRKLENMVFLELERRRGPLTELFFWKNPQQEEVDLVVKAGAKVEQLIQVCYNPADIATRKREVRVLLKASEELKCKDLLVITSDYEGEERAKGRKIRFIPAWKWLLAPSHKGP